MAFVSNLRPAGQLNQPCRADGKPVAQDQVHETVASRAVSMPAANRTFGKPCAKWPVAMQGNTGISRQGGVLTLHIDASDWAGARITDLWFAANDWGAGRTLAAAELAL